MNTKLFSSLFILVLFKSQGILFEIMITDETPKEIQHITFIPHFTELDYIAYPLLPYPHPYLLRPSILLLSFIAEVISETSKVTSETSEVTSET